MVLLPNNTNGRVKVFFLMSKKCFSTYCSTIKGLKYSECLSWKRASQQNSSRCQKIPSWNVTYIRLAFPNKCIITLASCLLDAEERSNHMAFDGNKGTATCNTGGKQQHESRLKHQKNQLLFYWNLFFIF